MIVKFEKYTKDFNKNKLYEQNDIDWKLILNISSIWNDFIYNDNNQLISFNEKYINFINKQKQLIIEKTSQDAWNSLNELIVKLNNNKNNIKNSISIWDDIYDWADGNSVQIKINNDELKKDF